jgi:DnaJ-class molecular chaperone
MASKKAKYLVKKVTVHSQPCPQCNGTGEVKDNGKCRKCIECEKGVVIWQHETEINLIDALVELGLLKNK